MKLLAPGTAVDGFVVHECLHAGGMAHIYRVSCADPAQDPGFPIVMKVPRMTAGDGAENIVGFEVELQILPALQGPHAPHFVAAGDLARLPYLAMEYVEGDTLQHRLDAGQRPGTDDIARLGAAMALAVHSLHQQNVCHLDLKPANVLLRPDGSAVLLDFGLSFHAHYPDLLAEEMREAVGSPAWIAPEQVVGVRGDLRSDVFAIGVMLYELATGELPFGTPATRGGLRQRLGPRGQQGLHARRGHPVRFARRRRGGGRAAGSVQHLDGGCAPRAAQPGHGFQGVREARIAHREVLGAGIESPERRFHRRHPAARVAGLLEDDRRMAGLHQGARTGDAGHARADHGDAPGGRGLPSGAGGSAAGRSAGTGAGRRHGPAFHGYMGARRRGGRG